MAREEDWATRSSDLHHAASVGDLAKVDLLIASGAAVNAFDDGRTPLHCAAEKGHLEIVKALMVAGADANAHDSSVISDTPLGLIAGNCSLEMAQLLVNAGADPSIRGWMQLCALDKAKDRKRGDGPAVYRLLLSASKHHSTEHRDA